MSVIAYCSRHQVSVCFTEEWAFVKDFFDEVMVRSLGAWKGGQKKSRSWWDSNKHMCGLCLPIDATEKCLKCEVDYQRVETELCQVVASSAIGRKLFGAAHTHWLVSRVSAPMNTILAELMSNDVTVETVKAARQKFINDQSEKGNDVKETAPKRVVEVTYRGLPFPCEVHSHFDEYQIREALLLEGAATQLKILPPLFCEDQLVNDSLPTIKLDAAVVAAAARARAVASESVGCESPSGEVILASFEAHGSQLLLLHRCWRGTASSGLNC